MTMTLLWSLLALGKSGGAKENASPPAFMIESTTWSGTRASKYFGSPVRWAKM
jgi:hypothetical protein